MKAILNDGTLEIYSHSLNKAQSIISPGDFVYVGGKYAGKNHHPRDTISYVASQDFKEAKMWIRKICIYKDMPLRAFVDEMSCWEGFTIKRWDCTPIISITRCRSVIRVAGKKCTVLSAKQVCCCKKRKGWLASVPRINVTESQRSIRW